MKFLNWFLKPPKTKRNEINVNIFNNIDIYTVYYFFIYCLDLTAVSLTVILAL